MPFAVTSHKPTAGPLLSLLFPMAILVLVAAADYLTGYELWFSIFYLIPVSLVTWRISWQLGLAFSIVSVLGSLAGDLASGARFSSGIVPWWNVLISLSFYLAMVATLSRLRTSHRELERRVQDRTADLRREIQQKEQLEAALLEVTEREQRRIGHDLHDSLCQHLTGTALAGQVLSENLARSSPQYASAASHLVGMIEDGIDLARSLARGLAPVELDMQGLMAALRELAHRTTVNGRINCLLDLPQPVLLNDSRATTQLFRIAQEAVRNAVRHSQAHRIRIGLHQLATGITMTVEDDGIGLSSPINGVGMGLHIMRHRADMIGASFAITRLPSGTRITVITPSPLPLSAPSSCR
jgi:signal transduction histidine kinase